LNRRMTPSSRHALFPSRQRSQATSPPCQSPTTSM
jgi:hypothetical protein